MANNNKDRQRSHKKPPNHSGSCPPSETPKKPAKKKSPRAKKATAERVASKPTSSRPKNPSGRRADRDGREYTRSDHTEGSASETMTMVEPNQLTTPPPFQSGKSMESVPSPSAFSKTQQPSQETHNDIDNDTTVGSDQTSLSSTSTSPYRSEIHCRLQAIYHRVCHLEDQCYRALQKISLQVERQAGDKATELSAETLDPLIRNAATLHAKLLDAQYDFLRAAHYDDTRSTKGLVSKYDIPSRLWSRGVYAFVHAVRNLYPHSSRYLADHLRHSAHILILLSEPYFDREADGKNLPTWTEAVGDLARIGMSIRTDDVIYWRGVAHWWYGRALLASADNGRPHHHLALVLACRLESLLSLCRATLCRIPFTPATNTMDALFNAGSAKMQRQGDREPLEVVVDSFISIHEGASKNKFPDIRQKLMSLGAVIARTPSPFLASRAAMFAAINIAGLHEYGRGSLVRVWELKNRDDTITVVIPNFNKYVAFHIIRAHLALASDKALPHIIPWLLFMLALSKHPDVFLEVFDQRFPWKDMLWYLNEIRQKVSKSKLLSHLKNLKDPLQKAPPQQEYVTKLPEEILLRGFSWARDVLPRAVDGDTRDIVNLLSLSGLHDYTIGESTRLSRAQDLIEQLGSTCLFQLDEAGLQLNPELVSILASKQGEPDFVAEHETYHEFLPDISGEDTPVTSAEIQSLCRKRDVVRQECGVQSKIENLELSSSPLAGEQKPNIIFDTNMWLDELEFITSVIEAGWLGIKLPVVVMYELQKLQTFNRDVRKSNQAQAALHCIKSKFGDGTNNVYVGLDGVPLTEQGCVEAVSRVSSDYGGSPKRGQPNMDELIIRTVSKILKSSRGGNVVGALLVTNDKNMRILALTQSVNVVSGAEFMNMYGEESGGRRNETPGIRSMRTRKSELRV